MLLQKGFQPFVLAQQSSKLQPNFLGCCRLVPLLACTPMFSRSVMFSENFWIAKLHKWTWIVVHVISADLILKLFKKYAVVKFQLLKNYTDIPTMYLNFKRIVYDFSQIPKDYGTMDFYFGYTILVCTSICWNTPPSCHFSVYHAHIWILGNNNVVLLFFIWPPEAFWSYFCCRSTNCVATGSNHIWMCIQYTSNYFLFPRLVLIFNLLQYESYIKFTHHYKQ